MSWELLLLAEISIVKALLSNRFSLVMGIDENFAGRFLLRFNLGYLLISQTGRFVHIFFVLFLTEEAYTQSGLQTRKLGQTPSC